MSQVGTKLGTITAGLITDNLNIGFYGATTGTYPYKQQMSEYSGVSQVEYKISKTVFTNYKVWVCPTKSGYYSTKGTITMTEYVPGKVAKGTNSLTRTHLTNAQRMVYPSAVCFPSRSNPASLANMPLFQS